MPAETLHTEGFVLTKRPAADPYQACMFFSAEQGALHVLQRMAKTASSRRFQLDLFDEAALELESSNQGRTWFVREARLISRPTDIGRSYEALQAAAAFTRVVSRNPIGAESRDQVAALLRSGLAAFAASARSDIVAFKCLYLFARGEGHPVKQQWLPMLRADEREAAERLLKLPLAEQDAEPRLVARLQEALEAYLTGHTEILLK